MALLLIAAVQAAAAGEGREERLGCRVGHLSLPSSAATRHSTLTSRHSPSASTLYIGERRQLVVLAAFADKSFKESRPLSLWAKVFNQPDFGEQPFYGSVRDYFYAQSYGQFRLTFDLHHITLADSCRKYRSTNADDENSRFLVMDIADSLTARGIDWSPYDWDGDGYIDQLLIVYAGKGMNDGGGSNTIWPHQWWLSQHTGREPRIVSSGGTDYRIDCYCCVQELTGNSTYGVFGTICHEYSHCFGLPDFYYGSTSYLYRWDLMDYGNNSLGGFCPPGYSAHERMFMGWCTLEELTEPTDISSMRALGDTAQAYLVRNDDHPAEFYVIENRQQRGWDRGLPASGVVVFHIDYDEALWRGLNNDFVNSPRRQHYNLFYASNRSGSSRQATWAYPYEGNDSLTNLSTPAATLWNAVGDGSRLMSKPITRIAVADGLASFSLMKPAATGMPSPMVTEQAPAVYYNLKGERVLSPSTGIYIVNGKKVLFSRQPK